MRVADSGQVGDSGHQRARTSSSGGPKQSRLEDLSLFLLALLLFWLPFAYGGVLPESHVLLMACVALLGLIYGVRVLLERELVLVWSWSYVPLLGLLLYVGFQLLPLPFEWLQSLAPDTGRLLQTLLSDPGSADSLPEKATLSLYPQGTIEDLRLLLAGGLLFFLTTQLCRSRRQVFRLLRWLAFVGGLVVLMTLAQNLTDSHSILWIWELPQRRSHSGPFVHYGHFSQFVNLTIGAALALLFVRAAKRREGQELEAKQLFEGLRKGQLGDSVLWSFIVLAMVAIALSSSRNGVISMLVAGVALAAVLQRARLIRGVGWPMAVLLLVALFVIIVVGFDPVYDRLSTLEDDTAYSGRFALANDSLSAWRSSPIFGLGLGSFEYSFPMFDTTHRAGTAQHAENQYLEILTETGLLGFSLFIAFLLSILFSLKRLLDDRRLDARVAGFGLCFGLVAVSFHALTDFGLRIPAVAASCLVVCGMIVGLSGKKLQRLTLPKKTLTALVTLGGAAVLLLLLPGAVRSTKAYAAFESVKKARPLLSKNRWIASAGEYAELSTAAATASENEPGNIEYRFWTVWFDWQRALAESRTEQAAGTPAIAEHSPELIASARQAATRLLDLRSLAPTHGALWSMLGQLEVLWLGNEDAARWIHRGRRLAPHNPATCLASARQLLREKRTKEAVQDFRRAVLMGASEWKVLLALLNEPGGYALARDIARDRPLTLMRLAAHVERAMKVKRLESLPADYPTELRSAALDLLLAAEKEGGMPSSYLAAIARELQRQGKVDDAIAYYRRYLVREPRSGLRINYARLLAGKERFDEARRELRRFLRHHPGNPGGIRYLKELSSR